MRAATAVLLSGIVCLGAAAPGLAKPPRQTAFPMEETFALGIVEHHLDERTDVIGWHLNGSWYLGREDGKDEDALALVWQGRRQQFTIFTEGVRFTRRF